MGPEVVLVPRPVGGSRLWYPPEIGRGQG